jgi:SAM-dependent methyltransferase
MGNSLKLGNFTTLAKAYINRPAYSLQIVDALLRYINANSQTLKVVDVGAGTGKLTKILASRCNSVDAVEPNDEMLQEGIKYTSSLNVNWFRGSAENTTLDDSCYDWVTMASSFHWTNPVKSLPELSRILVEDGYLTIIWNPRNIQISKLHSDIEEKIYELSRVSSGGKSHTKEWENVLTSTGHFKDVIFMECDHNEVMTKEQYMGAWDSVNDIRSQAGEKRWKKIISCIEQAILNYDEIIVPYKMRAWTCSKV